ncbi:zinc finger protein 808-like [Maniola jurtina]|uniref:zinc finger protein 808-like n=1 Tax=Maniola jurtina TaxID=191418 RepID=UPI001E68694F|nr:zinc finger protein 808-like [Maniola jurtina]
MFCTRTIKIERGVTKPRVQLKIVRSKDQEMFWSDTKKNQHNLKTILLNSNASPIRCKDSLGYVCAFCPDQFLIPTDLKKHFLDEHNNDRLIKVVAGKLFEHVVKLDITYLNCALCSKDIPKLEDLMAHLKYEHGKEMYLDIKNAIVPFKFDTPELRCAVCSAEYLNFKLLQEHMNSHFGNYICPVCGRGFMTERLLGTHISRHNNGEHKCEDCGKVFGSKANLREHQRRTHLGMSKRNKCLVCNERFLDYWKKIDHMVKVHGAPPVNIKCQACDRTFQNQRALARHTKKDHLLERKHQCAECEMRFFSTSSLARHMAKHTGLRQFRCDVCFKAYGRKNTLREHMRIHADDRRFACTHCGQAFVQKCSKPRESRRAFIKIEETSPVKKEINVRKEKIIKIVINKVGVSEKRKEADQHQNNIKEILLNTNATPIRCRLGIGYACCFCKEQFPDPADLKTHTIQHHTDEEKAKFMKGKDMHGYFVKLDITDLKCNLCEQKINSIEDVTDHLKKAHDRKMFTNLKNHILPFKFSKESLSCCICYNIFNSFKALQEHMNIHYRNYVCTVCDAGFVNRNILLRHGDAHKTGDFSCMECSKTFDTARKKRLHDRAKHSGQKLPHKCGYCTERFKEVWKKYEHLAKIHGIKGPTINCRACDKSFETKHAWRLHTTRVHLMQKYHKCTDCDMEFHTKKELESHMVRHTGTREFTCDICFKSYGRHKTMRDHVRRVHS